MTSCERCGHDFDPHPVVGTGETPTDGGVIICHVRGCLCYATWSVPQLGGSRVTVIEPSEVELARLRRDLQK